MNKKNVLNIAALAIVIGCAIVGVMAVHRRQVALADLQNRAGLERSIREPVHKKARSVVPETGDVAIVPPVIEAHVPPAEETGAAPQVPPPDGRPMQVPAPQPRGSQKAPAQDPTARAALSYVGEDPEANTYWAMAINNPDLPDEERKDLIEDLNEDGLSDPKHPGPQDLPLIANRIQIIQELAPDAMDQVNADAFAEAYKDLINMLNGQPVQ